MSEPLKFLHQLEEVTDTLPDDFLLISRNQVEKKIARANLFAKQGLRAVYDITAPIEITPGGLVPIKGAGLYGNSDFDAGVFDTDTGLFTAPYDGIFALEMEVEATSVTADGAGPLTLSGLATGGDVVIASQVVPTGYGTNGANTKWHGRFCSISLLSEEQDFYFGASRIGAPGATITGGFLRITKLI